MTLLKAEFREVRVPLLDEWTHSPEFGRHGSSSDSQLILTVQDETGATGWGEGRMTSRKAVEDLRKLLLKNDDSLGPFCQLDLYQPEELYWSRPSGASPYAVPRENLRHRLRHPLQNMVEMALTDLRARRLGLPLADLFGGRWRNEISTDYWMGRVTPEQARKCARRALSLGFRGLKLKTTLEDPNVERLESILEEAGADFHVTVDPNGRFYRLDDAMPLIRKMDSVGNMRILEDPFPRFHLSEFAELRQRIQARVVVHIDPPESLWTVLQSHAAGGLNLDSQTIGLFQWRILAGVAEQANLPIWHGSNLDLGIATAAQLHLAASAPNCQLPGDQIGPWLREHSLLKTPLVVRDGKIKLPTGAGLGIDVDLGILDNFTVWKCQSD